VAWRGVAWTVIATADLGVLAWGFLAAVSPTVLTAGFETYTGGSWEAFAARERSAADFILIGFRLVGALNVVLGLTLVVVAAMAFRPEARWAWWALLAGNTVAFGAPIVYDRAVGYIGVFEVLEYVALFAVYGALAATAPMRQGSRRAAGAEPPWTRSWSARIGAHPVGLWIIKHLISPFDRFLVGVSRGRLAPLSSLAVPTLLLTVVGRRSGEPRTVPLVFVRDGERYVVGNARPAGERRNPWIVNLRAAGRGHIQLDGQTIAVEAHELGGPEMERWWPALVKVWPAFAAAYAATKERTLFALRPQP
jgi:deazaflavin-dependent oxidoreductase (nitroreductase family)